MGNNIPLLLVDDNKSHLKLAALALAEGGYDIRTAGNAEETMKILAVFQPRLILMEIQLPGVNGLELTKRLKADPAYQDIIIVAITAYAMAGEREIALSAGCDGYIAKPIDIRTFPQTIADFISRVKTRLIS